MKKIWKFIKGEDGLELTEYAVMGALIVVAIVATIILLQEQIITAFNNIVNALTTANT